MSINSMHKLQGQREKSGGFTLIELMIAMVIGTIVTGAAIFLLRTSVAQNNAVTHKAHLQEESFFASHVLKQQIAQIGYRPIIQSMLDGRILPINDLQTAFPEVPNTWNAAQSIKVSGTVLSYRYYGASDDALSADKSIYDCLGNPVADGVVQSNQISLQDNQLYCTTDTDEAVILGAGQNVIVEDIAYQIGIDDDDDHVVDRLIDASTAANEDFVNAKQLVMRLLLATSNSAGNGDQKYYFNGQEYTSTDRKLRRETEIAMALRN